MPDLSDQHERDLSILRESFRRVNTEPVLTRQPRPDLQITDRWDLLVCDAFGVPPWLVRPRERGDWFWWNITRRVMRVWRWLKRRLR